MINDEEEEVTFPPRRAKPIDFLVVWFVLLHQVLTAFEQVVDLMVGILGSHANYLKEQSDFKENIRKEIESIPTKEK